MRITGTILAEVDEVCKYIPIVGTITSLVDIFERFVIEFLPKETIEKSRYLTHIKYKDNSDYLAFLPVIGQIYIIAKDYFEYKKSKAQCQKAIEAQKLAQELMARSLAMAATFSSGVKVSAEEMMPASTKDQQDLMVACFGANLNTARKLLNKGVSPNFYHCGQTPLIAACQTGNVELVDLLIQHDVEVNCFDRLGRAPFSEACTLGNLDLVRLLHPHIQDINGSNAKGITPLMYAALAGHRDLVAFLLENGADPYKRTKDGSDAITCAILPHDHSEVLSILLEKCEDIDAFTYQFQQPYFGLFPFLAPPLIQDLTPLLYATLLGKVKSAMYLLSRSDVRCSDSTKNTALYYSVEHTELLKALLDKCRESEWINQQNIVGGTALLHAIELGQPEAALLLLKCGADPFIADDSGKTSLILAYEKGLEEVVAYIQQHYTDKMTPEMQEQIKAAIQVYEDQKNRTHPEKVDLLSSVFSLMSTCVDTVTSDIERKVKEAKEIEEIGPLPRSGMEIFLGKLPWPEF